MIPPITKLLINIDQLECDLAEVKKELIELQASLMKSLTPEERKAVRLERIQAQRERLRSSIEKSGKNPDPDAQIPTAEELQQVLLKEGIKPEDNMGSRAIIEERERQTE